MYLFFYFFQAKLFNCYSRSTNWQSNKRTVEESRDGEREASITLLLLLWEREWTDYFHHCFTCWLDRRNGLPVRFILYTMPYYTYSLYSMGGTILLLFLLSFHFQYQPSPSKNLPCEKCLFPMISFLIGLYWVDPLPFSSLSLILSSLQYLCISPSISQSLFTM